MQITKQLSSLRYCQIRGGRKYDARVTGFAADLRITRDGEQLSPVRSVTHSLQMTMRTEQKQESRKRSKFSTKDFSPIIMPLLISVEERYARE